jgi:hypothetical protein
MNENSWDAQLREAAIKKISCAVTACARNVKPRPSFEAQQFFPVRIAMLAL